MATCPLVFPVPWALYYQFLAWCLVHSVRASTHALLSLPMASLASTISAALSKGNIKTVDEFATAVELSPGFVVNLLRNDGFQAQARHLHTETGTVTDATTMRSVGTQAAVAADDMVDTATAEAMVAEALCMLEEAQECEQFAVMRARTWTRRAELATSLLRAEENQTGRACAERLEAETRAAAEYDARQVLQQLLAAEAATKPRSCVCSYPSLTTHHPPARREETSLTRPCIHTHRPPGVRRAWSGVGSHGQPSPAMRRRQMSAPRRRACVPQTFQRRGAPAHVPTFSRPARAPHSTHLRGAPAKALRPAQHPT